MSSAVSSGPSYSVGVGGGVGGFAAIRIARRGHVEHFAMSDKAIAKLRTVKIS
jgi:hypothetical protein